MFTLKDLTERFSRLLVVIARSWREPGGEQPIAEPSFQIDVDERETLSGGYERFFALTIRNIERRDLKDCSVYIEKFSATSATMPMPFLLRTARQIQAGTSGRSPLLAGQPETVPVLFRNPRRRNEWFLFDEQGVRHFAPAHDAEMVISIFGGKRNAILQIRIELIPRSNWAARFSVRAARTPSSPPPS